VTDNTGAVVPNATITLTQIDTNFIRVVKSSDQGDYRAEFLPIGSYTAKVEAGSFQPFEQKGITLTATQHANLNFELHVGTESTVVEVTALFLSSISGTRRCRTVDSIEVDNLPLVGRNAYRLLDLTPGVQSNTFENPCWLPAQRHYQRLAGRFGWRGELLPRRRSEHDRSCATRATVCPIRIQSRSSLYRQTTSARSMDVPAPS
jgi:hypothetical protein